MNSDLFALDQFNININLSFVHNICCTFLLGDETSHHFVQQQIHMPCLQSFIFVYNHTIFIQGTRYTNKHNASPLADQTFSLHLLLFSAFITAVIIREGGVEKNNTCIKS